MIIKNNLSLKGCLKEPTTLAIIYSNYFTPKNPYRDEEKLLLAKIISSLKIKLTEIAVLGIKKDSHCKV